MEGLQTLWDYWAKGLAAYSDLAFKSLNVFVGVSSLVVYDESVGGRLSAEFMELNEAGKVTRVFAHDSAPPA